MNNHQRGVYQPLMDNVPIYDLSEEVDEEEHSRLPLLIVIALVVLASFAGVVWLAYNQGVARGRATATVVIAAPEGPVRTAPADAGGEATPYTGLKVYSQPVPPDQEAQSSALAPAPPRSIVPETSLAAGTPLPAPTPEAPPIRLTPEVPSVAQAPAAPLAAKPATTAPAPKAPAALATAQPPAPAATRAAVAGGVVLQIGAYETQEIADGAWAAFKARHASVAGTLAEDVQKADLGAKGTWYRLRVGPFADKTAAVAACEKLKTEGATCFVAAP